MAIPYVTGPAHLYVSFPTRTMVNSGTGLPSALTYPTSIYYLGTSQNVPNLDHSPVYEPVQNDIAGQQVPLDVAYQGEVARVTATLSRWNEYSLKELDKISAYGGSGARGKDVIGDIGSLMITEGHTFHCWVHFPYYSKFGSGFYMAAGYHYSACRMLPYQQTPGTTAFRRLFAIEALPIYNPSDGSALLYDETMTTIPAIPPVTATGLVT